MFLSPRNTRKANLAIETSIVSPNPNKSTGPRGLSIFYYLTRTLVLCAVVAVCVAETPRPQVSDTALEDALNDKRFIQRQLKCALGEAPCDPIGKRLKTLAPLVLRGACPQCTPQETKQIQRTLSYVQRNFPQQWAKIVRQYSG
ncbi:unnamed protein product [Euphydryas editha]|uniref:Uncharacterized protein n=1 Tax=Euphydryas editha TaxID=104508 RepID=A0AAU9TLA8_EUPED|nr:unnamed protein product [Euphydryas editha]